ncbi:leucine-rich receptor-like protein kinase family protein [Striga asiatica]|uniref:Leucine-rich receptor-like protein kinase family protein n=1 Tax=Striga asiatica TaxID=4170 RepID=A0A5A7PB06_STRAF|nr:leucine-rich receptor-like protein kinase family protein [Striga asiatica]
MRALKGISACARKNGLEWRSRYFKPSKKPGGNILKIFSYTWLFYCQMFLKLLATREPHAFINAECIGLPCGILNRTALMSAWGSRVASNFKNIWQQNRHVYEKVFSIFSPGFFLTEGLEYLFWELPKYRSDEAAGDELIRDLGSQGLKGYISDQIGLLTNLVSLDLSNNKFTGFIPDSLTSSSLQLVLLNMIMHWKDKFQRKFIQLGYMVEP